MLFPPLFALGVYAILSYVALPLWRRYSQQTRRQLEATHPLARYAPLGGASPADAFNEFANRVSALIGRPRRTSEGAEGYLGDEELEEGGLLHVSDGERGFGNVNGPDEDGGRRLSRELEGGFMDDSSDEEGHDDGRRLRLG